MIFICANCRQELDRSDIIVTGGQEFYEQFGNCFSETEEYWESPCCGAEVEEQGGCDGKAA